MIKISKDLSTIPSILKNNVEGLLFNDLIEEYQKITPSLNQFSKQYISNLITYGVKQEIFISSRPIQPFKRGLSPRKIKLKDLDITLSTWETLLELFKIDKKDKRKNNKKIIKEAINFKKDTILKQNYNNKNFSMVYDYLNKHNLDVLKYLPKGTSSSIESLFNLSKNQVKHILNQLRKQLRKHQPEKTKVKKDAYKTKRRPQIKKPKAVNLTSKAINTCFNDERKNPNKRFVESFFIGTAKQYLGEEKIKCLSLTGPDYKRHITQFFNSIAKKLIIVEKMNGVFKKICADAETCPYHKEHKVRLFNGDINDIIIPECKYVDLDFLTGLKATSDIILKQVKAQTWSLKKDSLKFITFTNSVRNDGGEKERFDSIKKLLFDAFQANLKSFTGPEKGRMGNGIKLVDADASLSYCLKKRPLFNHYGRIVDIQIISYSDTNPMISILVVYQ